MKKNPLKYLHFGYKSLKIIFYTMIIFFILIKLFFTFFTINTSNSIQPGIYKYIKNKNIKMGDIITFRQDPKYEVFLKNIAPEALYIKKIAATDKDKVYIQNYHIYVNETDYGVIYNYEFLPHKVKLPLSKDCYLVLSTHDKSFDSRYYGEICKDKILKKARLIYEFK